jgi:hypothetical protein
MKTSPDVGISSPAIMRRTVVFPPPLGPNKAINSPSLTENVTLRTAETSPKRFVTSFNSILTRAKKIRNPKVEARNKFEIRKSQIQAAPSILVLGALSRTCGLTQALF